MGKVTCYCQISGCTPDMARTWPFPDEVEDIDIDYEPGPLARAAWDSLMDDEEKRGQDDILAITCVGKNGQPLLNTEQIDPEEATNYSDLDVIVIPCKIENELWDFGLVETLNPFIGADSCCVSLGACFMVQKSALAILYHATQGRITAQKFWKLAMTMGRGAHSIAGLDYGKEMLKYGFEQLPRPMPVFEDDDYLGLESVGDVEKVKRAMVQKGHFWIWMAPDRFPLQHDSTEIHVPILLEPSSQIQATSKLESLPTEILSLVASNTDSASSLLSLTDVCQKIRSKLLGTESDRNALARAWISKNAPWFVPYTKVNDQYPGRDDFKLVSETADTGAISWTYLRRCYDSGSMKNRKRIWEIAERIEKHFNDLQL